MDFKEVRILMRDDVDSLEEWRDNPWCVKSLFLQAARKIACCLVPHGRGKKVARAKIKQLRLPADGARYVSSLVAMTDDEYVDFEHIITRMYKLRYKYQKERADAICEFYQPWLGWNSE